jgi:tetratricopeptide (TPR) repeat protein
LYNASLDLKAGRFRAARRGAEKYLTIRKDDPSAYFLVGEILRQRGEAEDDMRAKDFYEKAITLDPSYPDPHKAIGLIYFKEGAWMLAKRSFESSLALSPHMQDRAYIQGYLQECKKRGIDL